MNTVGGKTPVAGKNPWRLHLEDFLAREVCVSNNHHNITLRGKYGNTRT